VYTGLGCAIDDSIGIKIENKEKLPYTLNDGGHDSDSDVDTTDSVGSSNNNRLSGHKRVYYGGDEIYDMTLLPPGGLNVQQSSVTVNGDTLLSALMNTYQGCCIHWAACTIVR
jgi:hypothetical protein